MGFFALLPTPSRVWGNLILHSLPLRIGAPVRVLAWWQIWWRRVEGLQILRHSISGAQGVVVAAAPLRGLDRQHKVSCPLDIAVGVVVMQLSCTG